jgi:hypothetical protein
LPDPLSASGGLDPRSILLPKPINKARTPGS